MTPEIVVASDAPPALKEAVKLAQSLLLASASDASRKGYSADFAHFTHWTSTHGLCPLPASPETVTLYVAAMSTDYSLSTILRRLTSIGYAHRGQPINPASTLHPLLGAALKGLRRTKGTAHHQKDPLLTPDVRRILSAGKGLLGIRNAALLLVGYSSACRRQELVALNCSDVSWCSQGILVQIRRSKTDGVAKGRTIGIPFGADETTCPVRCLKRWLDAAGISGADEPIFRGVSRYGRVSRFRLSPGSVARIIKAAAGTAGMAEHVTNLAGHSLRAGHVSQAALAHVDEATAMSQTGHTSPEIFRQYRRIQDIFALNSAAHLGL